MITKIKTLAITKIKKQSFFTGDSLKKLQEGTIYCPVCGYYCTGKGGKGCIDKPTLYLYDV